MQTTHEIVKNYMYSTTKTSTYVYTVYTCAHGSAAECAVMCCWYLCTYMYMYVHLSRL